mgnify:CR=1 FL=1
MKNMHSKVFKNKEWGTSTVLENTLSDGSGRVSKWYNLAPGHEIAQDLNNPSASTVSRPFYDEERNCIKFISDEVSSGCAG